ncbi:hypothetical protein AZ036_002476, partial [Klebsiella michiganensis]
HLAVRKHQYAAQPGLQPVV